MGSCTMYDNDGKVTRKGTGGGVRSINEKIESALAKRKDDTGMTWREIILLGIEKAEKIKEEDA